jgi:hypothetical protein
MKKYQCERKKSVTDNRETAWLCQTLTDFLMGNKTRIVSSARPESKNQLTVKSI